MAEITDAVEILKRTTGIDPDSDPEMLQMAEDLRIGQLVYDARTEAGLSQEQLAQAVGTSASVIDELEAGNYDGNSLAMLHRIARAVRRRVEIHLAPEPVEHAAG